MLVTVTPKVLIPYNTTITLSTAKYWPTSAVQIDQILSSPVYCQPVTNVSANIQCTMTATSSLLTVTATNVVDSDWNAGITFSISPMVNPPTTEPQGSFEVSAKKDGNILMAKCSGSKVSGITPGSLAAVSYIV